MFLLTVLYSNLLIYGLQQAQGQWKIVSEKTLLEDEINQHKIPKHKLSKLQLIESIKEFSFNQLQLDDLGQYKYFYNQKGQPGMYVLTGCPPFSLTPYQWKAGPFGEFPYKGFFDLELAESTEQKWKAKGLDTNIGITNAWSTLGWFEDPIMSSIIERSEGRIAQVIIHELTHGTIFVKNDLTFNENLASFIGDEGTIRFLKHHFGSGSKELKTFQAYLADGNTYEQFMHQKAKVLSDLYQSISDASETIKLEMKQSVMKDIARDAKSLKFNNAERFSWLTRPKKPFNNTLFADFQTYKSNQHQLHDILYKDFNGDLKSYIQHLKEKYE